VKKAVAYFRTSSATNIGDDRDSEQRQRIAVTAFAARNDIEIVDSFYDAAVSGADHLDERAGFKALLQRIAGNGVRTILVETANRFARDLMVQETGWLKLKNLGIELISVDSPNAFIEDTPTAVLIRQILGAVAQFDRALTVAKLQAARERKKAATGKCEGRKSWQEMDPKLVRTAKALRAKKLTLRQISAELANQGYMSHTGKPLSRTVLSRMTMA